MERVLSLQTNKGNCIINFGFLSVSINLSGTSGDVVVASLRDWSKCVMLIAEN